jgi:hypothetical protein
MLANISRPLYLVGALLPLFAFVYLMESAVVVGDFHSLTWFPLINLNHNGFHSWRIDHVTQLCAALVPTYNFAERPVVGIVILLLGTWLLVREVSATQAQSKQSPPLLAGAGAVFLLVFTVGLDPVVIGALAWTPLVAVLAARALRNERPVITFMALACASIELVWSANQTALVGSVTALWLALSLANSKPHTRPGLIAVSLLVLAPTLFTTVTAPMAEIPNYRKSAHVLPIEDTYGSVRPLIGPTYPFEVLDRRAVRKEYEGRAIAVLALACVAWLVRRRHQAAMIQQAASVGLWLTLFVTLSTALPEPWATISPLPSLSRVLPWATSYSLKSVILGLGTWLTATSLLRSSALLSSLSLATCSIVLLLAGSPHFFKPVLRERGLATDPELRPIIISPSAAIVRSLAEANVDIPARLAQIRATTHIPSKDVRALGGHISIEPAPLPEILEQAKKTEGAWRWSTRTGNQRGNEVLTIRFEAPQELGGIELDPGQYFTDYPRGLRIHGGACEQATAPLIASYPAWQGSLHVTYRGAPYYSARNEVRVVFPALQSVSCLFIYQTARAPFDWSVSTIKILLPHSTKR